MKPDTEPTRMTASGYGNVGTELTRLGRGQFETVAVT